MRQEIEVKHRLDDPDALRARLHARGARRVGCVLEASRIFDTARRTLLGADCGLRLRTSRLLAAAAETPTPGVSPGNRAPDADAGAPSDQVPAAGAPCSRARRAAEHEHVATATLTYKGPRAAGAIKTREEIETAVTDLSATVAILRRLGFTETVVYEKHRETWRLGDCEICLDELPTLGWFVEIEGPTSAAVKATCEQLGLAGREPISETYVELAEVHGEPDAGGAKYLRFGP